MDAAAAACNRVAARELVFRIAFVDWYERLRDPTTRRRIDACLDRVRNGNMGDVRPVGEGLSELRLAFEPGYHEALQQGRDRVEITWRGGDYAQAPFKYQSRCLADLCGLYGALSVDGRARVDAALGDQAAVFALCG